MLNKIKYYIYSRKYKKVYTSKGIDNITKANFVYLGRQNGKTIMSYKMSYKWNYIRSVERYDFKSAKLLKKCYKKTFHKKIF